MTSLAFADDIRQIARQQVRLLFHPTQPEVSLEAPRLRRALAHVGHQIICRDTQRMARAERDITETSEEAAFPAGRGIAKRELEFDRSQFGFGFSGELPRSRFLGQ